MMNFDMSGIPPKVREILEDLDGRIPAEGMHQGAAVADAAGEAPTAEEYNALLASLRAAGIIAPSE
jgi:hypothetical protein